MKGFMQVGKFHPIAEYKKVRKSRDTSTKEHGVKIRKAKSTKVLHKNAEKVNLLMENHKDFGIEGSRFLTVDGVFSEEHGTHEEEVDKYRKLLGMKKDPSESDTGSEFMDLTGVIRTQIDLTGKSLGKPTINLEARVEPTRAQMKVLRKIVKESDVPRDNIILSDSYVDWKRFETGIGYR